MFNNFFSENLAVYGIISKHICRSGQAKDDSMAHAHFMLYTKGYKHKLRIRNIYCSPTATMLPRTRLNVTLYVHCLSCA